MLGCGIAGQGITAVVPVQKCEGVPIQKGSSCLPYTVLHACPKGKLCWLAALQGHILKSHQPI